jgi:hypothetical protein
MWVQVPPAVLYNIIMKIVVEKDGFNYVAFLYIDDEKIATYRDSRPGCCVRGVMNELLYKYGKPEGTLTINVDGW